MFKGKYKPVYINTTKKIRFNRGGLRSNKTFHPLNNVKETFSSVILLRETSPIRPKNKNKKFNMSNTLL